MGFDFSGNSRPLTLEEVSAHEKQVAAFVQQVGVGLDFLLWHANKLREEPEVWIIPDPMAVKYAHFILRRAKAVGWLGEAVRQLEIIEGRGEDVEVAWDFTKRLIASPIFVQSNGGFAPWVR